MDIRTKRIYDPVDSEDGYRVLIDRLWPRGVSKERARLDEWNRDVSPSTHLRKWFDHRSERFAEFSLKYEEEMKSQSDQLARLRRIAEEGTLTLLFTVKDPSLSHATSLKELLEREKENL